MTSELFKAMIKTEAAFNRDNLSLEKMRIADGARKTYYDALEKARTNWRSVVHKNKESAEENANDTDGTHEDALYWFEIAERSLDF